MRGSPSQHPQRGAPTANWHPCPAPAWPRKHQTQPAATLSHPPRGARKTNYQSFLLSHDSLNSVKPDSSLHSQLSHQHFQASGRQTDTCVFLYIKSYVFVNTQMISMHTHQPYNAIINYSNKWHYSQKATRINIIAQGLNRM